MSGSRPSVTAETRKGMGQIWPPELRGSDGPGLSSSRKQTRSWGNPNENSGRRDSPGRLLRWRGWPARVFGVGGEVAGGRGGFRRRLQRRGAGSCGQYGLLLRQRCSLARLNGGVSGKLCAGKRFMGVSRGQGEGFWGERRSGRAWRGRPPT
jgi:hypothetical protein